MIFATKPTIVGHRGFGAGERAGYRENTLESYLAAVAHGLSWIELCPGMTPTLWEQILAGAGQRITHEAVAEAGRVQPQDLG